MLTARQIDWARSHDWFLGDKRDGTIWIVDRYSQQHADGSITHHEETIHFTQGFQALRDWAGY
ncbi:hypothetical protein [Bradyrhizobium sp. USDA 4508]